MKPIGIRAVYELSTNIDKPVIGVGGIMTGEDVVEYLMAGASAVQVGSAVFYHGINVFNKINKELTEFMEMHEYNSISELIGKAHER
jgi:dihydroorotate dehydrogenase (NAD+) catalytic subunit